MSTIAPHIEQFAAEFANGLFPKDIYPASYSDTFHMAAVAIQKWESSKAGEPSKSAFTSVFQEGDAPFLPTGKRFLWRDGNGEYVVGEAGEILADPNNLSYLDAYADLPFYAEVL